MKQKFIEWFTKNNNGCSPAMEDDRSFVYEMTQNMFEAYQAGVAEGEAKCAALAAENAGLKDALAAKDSTIATQQQEIRTLLNALEAAGKRIAELQARLETADKLQDSAFRHGLQHGFSLGQTDNQAGFEECLSAYGTGKGE
ncbi:ead/Ea22-like family protein [Enterobacter hormaechei]|nr:ead/Ea22-like family protein [Enterobacter hormaechei]HAS1013378.1 ead/Ea22-like family protein [Enterobacter roggenkampii]HCT5190012.1 ead/Ea22-like family protein [Enterobacter roggenkampii]HCT5200074.1 ead/Ea22-like family protein [Enterobacter roggenkampii]